MINGLNIVNNISFINPNGAYYLLVKYPNMDNSVDVAIDILENAKVEVVPGNAFGPGGEGHIRLSFAGTPKDITEGIARLKKYFEEKTWKK